MTTVRRVAVNLLWLTPGRVGGSEEYLVRQLDGLPKSLELDVTLYGHPDLAGAYPTLASRFEIVAMPFRRDIRGARIVLEHTWFAARCKSADLVHHGGGTMPVFADCPAVLTVHDLQYLQFPQYFDRKRITYLRRMVPRSVRRATIVAAPSNFVRDAIVTELGADPNRVVVVPHGVPESEPPDDGRVGDALTRYGIGKRPYVVYPAITHPHKGHRVLVEMMLHTDPELLLVLTGGKGAAEDSLLHSITEAGIGDRVVRTGRVPSDDRDALIRGAQALVFPSEFEGFGAPLIEAMALGTPVVCGSHRAVREVVGDAAVIVDSPAGQDWAAALSKAWLSRDALIAAGAVRSRVFSIEASGIALADAYRLAIDN